VKIAYLDCFSGISGDMFLGALVDAGVPIEVLQDAVASLNLDAQLALSLVVRSGIAAAKVDVLTAVGEVAEVASSNSNEHSHTHNHDHPHDRDHGHAHEQSRPSEVPHVHGRSLSKIEEIIGGSALAEGVKLTALKAFHLLGHAEAKIHNVPVETIHFHEVGAVDAIADIVGVAAGCHWLAAERQVERWLCSPLNVGGGHVHCAHGKFPVPAPATLELLRDLPVYSSGVKKELVTPTGAALLRALDVTSSGFPPIRMSATGYGAGSREIPGEPNVLRLVVGEASSPALQSGGPNNAKVGIIETTIDDATPELLSYVADRLLAAGASDVYRTAVQMKKGRTGTQLTILCTPAKAAALQKLVFLETTTLGLRYREEEKKSLERSIVPVSTEWGEIRMKTGLLDGGVVNYAPEYEDCRMIAESYGVPLKQVMQAAVSAWREQRPPR
jgi:pyridinium-3,5-bisthiocarboxylic acid mononucleotide nickel chelatase